MPTTEPRRRTDPTATGTADAGTADPGIADTELSARLLACRDAEDYFIALDVPYDPQLLRVNRLHVLRMFGPALQQYLGSPVDADPRAAQRLREALVAAHDAFVCSTALDHRLFKVLQDRAPRGFVSLDSLTVEPVPGTASATEQQMTAEVPQ